MSQSPAPPNQHPASQDFSPESPSPENPSPAERQPPENLRQLDARGLRCPLPLLRLKQTLHGMAPGDKVEALTTDPASVRDFQAFLRQGGHELLELREPARAEINEASRAAPDYFLFRIRKAG